MRHPLDRLQPEEGFAGEPHDEMLKLAADSTLPCATCYFFGEMSPATVVCMELGQPICEDHAVYCREKGHQLVEIGNWN